MVVVEGEDGVELRVLFRQRWSEMVDIELDVVMSSVGSWRNTWEVEGGDAAREEEG